MLTVTMHPFNPWGKLSHMVVAPWLNPFWQWLLPAVCHACDLPMQNPGSLCESCAKQFSALAARPRCGQCAMPLVDANFPCPHCLGTGPAGLKRLACLAVYQEPLKSMVIAGKFHSFWPTWHFLGDQLAMAPGVAEMVRQADLLIPVPLHWRRRFQRGYNQSHLLAKRLAGIDATPIGRPLFRTRPTREQSSLGSRAGRMENVKDAFALVRPGLVEDRNILLIDDVRTTGATLTEAARALRRGKPASISAVVLAIADPHGQDFKSI